MLTPHSDKKNATTYQLVHRSQNDPLINDDSLPDRLLYQVSGPSTSSSNLQSHGKGLHLADLEEELDFKSVRENEGEAANYGIYFDDSSYDYMQHLRDLGGAAEESHFLDAAPVTTTGKGKGKARVIKLEDALRGASLDESHEEESLSVVDAAGSTNSSVQLPDGAMLPAKDPYKRTYQDQQDVPDAIAGFQPDMDPRLRETLEALEDEAYVDDKDEQDLFASLVDGGQAAEVDVDEFDAMYEDDEDWESDVTEKPVGDEIGLLGNAADVVPTSQNPGGDLPVENASIASQEDGDWMKEFAKFKGASPASGRQVASPVSASAPSVAQTSRTSLYTAGGTPLRKKRRKGALTNPSAFSMSSSSLARTEGQQLLDQRFDRLEAIYDEDEGDDYDDEDGGMSVATDASKFSTTSKMSRMSSTSTRSFRGGPLPGHLDSMMNEFLGGWNQGHPDGGKRQGPKGKRGKNGNEVLGIKMLDEVRHDLGPARIAKAQKA